MTPRWVLGLVAGCWTAAWAAPVAPPRVMLWSWYTQEDLRPVADRGVGVAYLALTLEFDGQDEVRPNPRAAAIRIPPAMYRMAVVRFDAGKRPAYSPRQRELAVKMIAEIVALARPQAVQIDFDAPLSARTFYRQLLAEVRARLGPEVFLSMTALVSWCDGEQSWMAGLPVDEIVPMAFSMGQARPATITLLQRGGQFAFAGCRGSIGVNAGGEVMPRKEQRAYFFPGGEAWTLESVTAARKAVR
jgi:hypothetical protein